MPVLDQSISFTSSETAHRIAVIRRLKSLLEEQRDKFGEYLELLERESQAISRRDTAALMGQVEHERRVVQAIVSFNRIIGPIQEVYLSLYPERNNDIESLKAAVDRMRDDVVKKNEANRVLLRARMNELKDRVESLKSPIRRAAGLE